MIHQLKRSATALLAVTALMAGSIGVSHGAETEQQTIDGLVLKIDDKHRKLYVAPEASFAAYKRYVLMDPMISFRKNWQRDTRSAGRRISDKQMEEIREVAAELLVEVFNEEFQKGGYEQVETGGEDVIVFRPAIIDLDITAPDVPTASRTRSWTDSSMSATLVLDMFDSTTGAVLARGASAQRESSSGFMSRANSVTNRADAKRIYQRWASRLREAWDNARAKAAE